MEVTRTLRLKNPAGLHARPCHALVTTALAFDSDVRIACDGVEVNGKSILELMTLSAGPGADVEVRAWGGDAEALLLAIEQLFTNGFGED